MSAATVFGERRQAGEDHRPLTEPAITPRLAGMPLSLGVTPFRYRDAIPALLLLFLRFKLSGSRELKASECRGVAALAFGMRHRTKKVDPIDGEPVRDAPVHHLFASVAGSLVHNLFDQVDEPRDHAYVKLLTSWDQNRVIFHDYSADRPEIEKNPVIEDLELIRSVTERVQSARAPLPPGLPHDLFPVNFKFDLEFDDPRSGVPMEEAMRVVEKHLKEGIPLPLGMKIGKIRPGCIEIAAYLTRAECEELRDDFDEGLLDGTPLSDIIVRPMTPEESTRSLKGQLEYTGSDPQSRRRLIGLFQSSRLRQILVDSFTNLRALTTPRHALARDTRLLEQSVQTYFGASALLNNPHWLRRDLLKAYVVWPILTGVVCVPLQFLILGNISWMTALLGWALSETMALAGGLVCSSLVSILGCAYGAMAFTLFWSVALSYVVSHVGLAEVVSHLASLDPIVRIVGGVTGGMMDHPFFQAVLPLPWTMFILGCTAFGIALTAVSMNRPAEVSTGATSRPNRPWLGGIVGSTVGALIGLTFGMTQVLIPVLGATWAFSIAFLLSGGGLFWGIVRAQTKTVPMANRLTFAYVVTVALLLLLTFNDRQNMATLLSAGALTAIFHATFFTGSYLLGSMLGGPRAAVWAAILEGMGYLVYCLIRLVLGGG